MAIVTGLTAERMLGIEAESIVGARIEGVDLILTTHGGVDINVGAVVGADGTLANADAISDATTIGKALIRAVDTAAGRTAIAAAAQSTADDLISKSGGVQHVRWDSDLNAWKTWDGTGWTAGINTSSAIIRIYHSKAEVVPSGSLPVFYNFEDEWIANPSQGA